MDWYLRAPDPEAVSSLRRAIGDYLARHAATGSDLEAASLVVSEILTNSLLHAGGSVWVGLTWSDERPLLEVNDLGPGYTPDPRLPEGGTVGGRGLFLVSHLSDELRVAAKAAGGTRVRARLPVTRPAEPSFAPRPIPDDGLPQPEEADAEGHFGRESFLRALVVELARAVEQQHGPVAAEHAVSDVAAIVGRRMEDEYRRARGLVGRLSPERIADLYVRLKRAIDGDFYVIEATEERIVLGNRRCPFGEVVRAAPGLCRMTSAVFGGIGARNAGGEARVLLEERIAVGDPECRVVVTLATAAGDPVLAGEHEYSG